MSWFYSPLQAALKSLSSKKLLACALLCTLVGANLNAAVLNFVYQGIRYRTDTNRTVAYVQALKDAYYIDDVVVPAVAVYSAGELPVVGIYGSAFSDCNQLKSVVFPESVTEITSSCFSDCTSLERVEMPGVTKIGDNSFYGCEALTELVMPKVKTIGNWTFVKCYSLPNLTFPETLTTIGNYSFDKNTSQTLVDLPASVTSLGGFIWEGCPDLQTMICRAATPPAIKKGQLDGDDIYTIFDDNDYQGRTLYVPAESINLYRGAFGWNHFGSNIYPIEDLSGVEVAARDAAFEVAVVGKGTVAVTVSASTHVLVANVAGQLVRDVVVPAGTTELSDLPSGILIVNGKKVIL